jgi:antitoxin component of MazEF toxin-antitoxin module
VVSRARVFKAGNSLAIRIPHAIADRMSLSDGASVEVAEGDGILHVRKATSQQLSELIERITPDNLHEPMFEELKGAERW